MGRNRRSGRENWPVGMRQKKVRGIDRLFFLDIDEKSHYFPKGTSVDLAIATVEKYNKKFRSSDLETALLEQARKADKYNKPLKEWLPVVRKRVAKSGLAKSTLSTFLLDCDRLSAVLGEVFTKSITLEHVNDFLTSVTEGKSDNVYNRKISFLKKVFTYLKDESAMKTNWAENKMLREIAKKKRQRLSEKDFVLMLNAAKQDPKLHWLYVAMSLSLQTTHGVLEISRMKYSDVIDNHLRVHRQKVQDNENSRVEIPISSEILRILKESRSNFASPYIVHRIGRYRGTISEGCDHPLQVSSKYISRGFSKLRDQLGICKNMPKNERPTFHEIRALSIYLYKKRLKIDPMQRAAHSKAETTDKYAKGHEDDQDNWIRVVPAEIRIK